MAENGEMVDEGDGRIRFRHRGGRLCTWDSLQKQWRYGSNREVTWPCNATHPELSQGEKPNDRGEFGMPTLGSIGWALADEAQITHPPDPAYACVITHRGMGVSFGENGYNTDATTPEARRILESLPDWLSRFLRKNTKYARAQNLDLGAAGVMPDINRKTSVLMDRIWYGAGEVDEGTIEVIDDLIGHLLLLRDKLEQDKP